MSLFAPPDDGGGLSARELKKLQQQIALMEKAEQKGRAKTASVGSAPPKSPKATPKSPKKEQAPRKETPKRRQSGGGQSGANGGASPKPKRPRTSSGSKDSSSSASSKGKVVPALDLDGDRGGRTPSRKNGVSTPELAALGIIPNSEAAGGAGDGLSTRQTRTRNENPPPAKEPRVRSPAANKPARKPPAKKRARGRPMTAAQKEKVEQELAAETAAEVSEMVRVKEESQNATLFPKSVEVIDLKPDFSPPSPSPQRLPLTPGSPAPSPMMRAKKFGKKAWLKSYKREETAQSPSPATLSASPSTPASTATSPTPALPLPSPERSPANHSPASAASLSSPPQQHLPPTTASQPGTGDAAEPNQTRMQAPAPTTLSSSLNVPAPRSPDPRQHAVEPVPRVPPAASPQQAALWSPSQPSAQSSPRPPPASPTAVSAAPGQGMNQFHLDAAAPHHSPASASSPASPRPAERTMPSDQDVPQNAQLSQLRKRVLNSTLLPPQQPGNHAQYQLRTPSMANRTFTAREPHRDPERTEADMGAPDSGPGSVSSAPPRQNGFPYGSASQPAGMGKIPDRPYASNVPVTNGHHVANGTTTAKPSNWGPNGSQTYTNHNGRKRVSRWGEAVVPDPARNAAQATSSPPAVQAAPRNGAAVARPPFRRDSDFERRKLARQGEGGVRVSRFGPVPSPPACKRQNHEAAVPPPASLTGHSLS